jgi:nucleotide-binding universal stress UspA family protein
MYRHILIPLENSAADQTILDHIKPLARLTGAKLLLVHVANGWVARNFNRLNLAESEEMKIDRAYLETRCQELALEGVVSPNPRKLVKFQQRYQKSHRNFHNLLFLKNFRQGCGSRNWLLFGRPILGA